MSKAEVTEQELDAAIDLSAQGEYSVSLALYQEMLLRAKDADVRRRVLFGIVTCSTSLRLNTITEDAIQELRRLPDYDVSHAFVVRMQAMANFDSGCYWEALSLINENLRSEVMQRDDFRDSKYEHLYFKGRSLARLERYDEALCAFDEAHCICPEGHFETDMLVARSNCFLALSRYDEAYESASQVLSRDDQDMATFAMQQMAESRLWQSRASEALELYGAIQKRLPCRLVQEERIQTGIKNAMSHLETQHPSGKPS